METVSCTIRSEGWFRNCQVCSQFWESARNSFWGPFNTNSRGNPSLCRFRTGGGLRGTTKLNKNFVNKLAFPNWEPKSPYEEQFCGKRQACSKLCDVFRLNLFLGWGSLQFFLPLFHKVSGFFWASFLVSPEFLQDFPRPCHSISLERQKGVVLIRGLFWSISSRGFRGTSKYRNQQYSKGAVFKISSRGFSWFPVWEANHPLPSNPLALQALFSSRFAGEKKAQSDREMGFNGRLIFIHHQCWEVLPFCRFQRQWCIKIRVLRAQDFYTPLALKTAKGQHLPALVVYKNQSPIQIAERAAKECLTLGSHMTRLPVWKGHKGTLGGSVPSPEVPFLLLLLPFEDGRSKKFLHNLSLV